MSNLYEQLQSLQFTWRDAVDILIVAFVLYMVLRLIRGTRAMQMSIGLMVLGAAYLVARALDLAALEAISRQIFFYLPFALVVLFQNEIRSGLAAFGKNPLQALPGGETSAAQIVAPIVEAVRLLAHRKVGALIAIERTQSLRLFIERGKLLDARLTAELLGNIFTPGAPLHDGAVIIQQGRIAAASVLLPLSATTEVKGHGSRHRAAVGLSEETDAFVIVVSEENGSIAAASDGVLDEHLTAEGLSDRIEKVLTRRGDR
ncbi:MAG TPA: diadenylate cyclase CdaA [Thermoanaerobaculia bacterium]|nr:diadenylate cyclase CdaA [Thermoanaerobaculia bacterium]